MKITKVGSQPSGKGPADWFTGMVRVDPLFKLPIPRWYPARASPSSPVLAQRGTRIHLDKL